MNITSCNDRDTLLEDGDSNTITKIIPTMDWGTSQSDVRSKQSTEFSLIVSTETQLRYADKMQEITIDYNFEKGKLTSASLTQARISSIDDMVKYWLKGYKQLAKSETTLLYVSQNNTTLAYGKILKGSECNYASIAWTYIDESEVTNDGPDFSPSGQENGYDYVDLGIGIGWAVQNVGASSPEKSGGYYMWGETTTRTNCWWWYYSLYTGDVNSYLDESKFYTPYSNISGTNYDAAKAKMGGKWRMPTRAELYTLFNNCEFKVGEYNGVEGFIVTGTSGKSIFLPNSGLQEKDEVKYMSVYLWSSTTYGKSRAYRLNCITKNFPNNSGVSYERKWCGMPIRGVIDLE